MWDVTRVSHVPPALVLTAGFVFGLLIGSFLNVVIWRVPRGENLNRPGSHCPVCEHPIRPHDNIPVVSWLVLRGRCRDCGTPISPRYPLVELGTGIAFAVTTVWIGVSWLLLPMLWFVAVSIALSLIDLDLRRLPNAIVLPSWAVVGAGLLFTGLVEGTMSVFLRAMIAALAMGGIYLVLALVFPAGMGMGDVKLAVLLGMVLGWFGWPQVIVGFFLGFFLGALWGVGLMIAGKAGRKSALPFGPFMIAGCWVALFWGAPLAQAYGRLLATG